jgi:hypothetical protein
VRMPERHPERQPHGHRAQGREEEEEATTPSTATVDGGSCGARVRGGISAWAMASSSASATAPRGGDGDGDGDGGAGGGGADTRAAG